MPKTIRAGMLGFCPGVRRALGLVEKALGGPDNVATIGPIVHNRRLVDRLACVGATMIDQDDADYRGVLVIRSHGVPREVESRFERPGVRLIEGTCPRVSRIHHIAAESAAGEATLVVIGEPDHAEVRGIVSRGGVARIIETVAEAEAIELTGSLVVVSQTTFGRRRYEEIVSILRSRFPDARIVDTICGETDRRNVSAQELAETPGLDAIIVIGDARSANTRRLLDASLATGKPAWQVESASELPDEIGPMKLVGLTAGASTPDWVIDEVDEAIRTMDRTGCSDA